MTMNNEPKLPYRIELSQRAAEQLEWLVTNLFTTYLAVRSHEYYMSITLERAISDMYDKHVREL